MKDKQRTKKNEQVNKQQKVDVRLGRSGKWWWMYKIGEDIS